MMCGLSAPKSRLPVLFQLLLRFILASLWGPEAPPQEPLFLKNTTQSFPESRPPSSNFSRGPEFSFL